MLRCLPPVGQSIGYKAVFGSLFRDKSDNVFAEQWSHGTPCKLVSSGSAALVLALKSLKVKSDKNQVIVPAYTCPSVFAAVVKAGLEPVLCDLKPFSFQLDLEQVSSKIGNNTLAVIAVHLFGLPENIKGLKAIKRMKGVFLIEDAAQAFGNKIEKADKRPYKEQDSQDHGKYLGFFGDLSVFSFGRGKPFSLLSGGAVIVNNSDLLEPVNKNYNSLKSSNQIMSIAKYFTTLLIYSAFFHPRMYWFPQSLPWLKLGETVFTLDLDIKKINPFVIKLGNELFPKFNEIRKNRLRLTKNYIEALTKFEKAFEFMPSNSNDEIALLRFPIIFKRGEERNKILLNLKMKGLGATGSYPVSINKQQGVSKYLKTDTTFPNAEIISERILTLPLHEFVTSKDIENIAEIFSIHL
ncbi:MAG: DegT/DnrJ/EryC1/StrS family aminotransferase [Desulfobacula sp.]|nr:DegT/DnrJ/EryC1/StrS family aminotransferase [Desulfobacula sp.]